jgi:hypothetical protein
LGTRYSPHPASPFLEDEIAGLSNAIVINVYNPLSDDQCGISIRNQWLEAPDAMPDTSCIEQHTSFDPWRPHPNGVQA